MPTNEAGADTRTEVERGGYAQCAHTRKAWTEHTIEPARTCWNEESGHDQEGNGSRSGGTDANVERAEYAMKTAGREDV